jgi:hypothetical protein
VDDTFVDESGKTQFEHLEDHDYPTHKDRNYDGNVDTKDYQLGYAQALEDSKIEKSDIDRSTLANIDKRP